MADTRTTEASGEKSPPDQREVCHSVGSQSPQGHLQYCSKNPYWKYWLTMISVEPINLKVRVCCVIDSTSVFTRI